jgi:hypothetical protein
MEKRLPAPSMIKGIFYSLDYGRHGEVKLLRRNRPFLDAPNPKDSSNTITVSSLR